MKWDDKWDRQTKRHWHKAQDEYAKSHPQFKKALRAAKRARLQKAMDAFDNEYDEPGFMDGRKQCAAESVKKKVTNKVNILVNQTHFPTNQ